MIKHSVSLTPNQQGQWFIVNRGRIWLTSQRQIPRGKYSELTLSAEPEQVCRLGELDGLPAMLLVNHDHIADEAQWASPRELLSQGDALFQLAARAVQVAKYLGLSPVGWVVARPGGMAHGAWMYMWEGEGTGRGVWRLRGVRLNANDRRRRRGRRVPQRAGGGRGGQAAGTVMFGLGCARVYLDLSPAQSFNL